MTQNMEQKIEKLVGELTLEEKVGMIHGAGLFRTEGVERLGIPPLKMADGPMGVRAEFANAEWRNTGTTDDYVSYLPSNSALASTWNVTLANDAGEVLGEEARGRGKDVILAPGINIKRSPYCGRNFEYMSEDPKLIEKLVVPFIKGVQKADVASCVKHFAANSQETERLWVDTIVDERTLHEIYYPGFKAAVKKAGTYSLMGAYNLLNGEHCCYSPKLLDGLLRDEWKYDGTVISDWGGVHETEAAANSSLDIEMDVTYDFTKHNLADALIEKIQAGDILEEAVNAKVKNILRMMYRLHMIGEDAENRNTGTYNTKAHQEAVLEVARESIILLKNEEERLPIHIKGLKKIAIIGQNAPKIHSNGGGSAEIKALYEISPLMGIKKLLGGNVEVSYAAGYDIPTEEEVNKVNWQAESTKQDIMRADLVVPENKERKATLLAEAIELAKSCDEVIFVGGLNHDYDVEGRDRNTLELPYGQNEVIEELLKVNAHMVVVMCAGSPVAMPWADKVKAIVWNYYAGMESGTALAEVLFGKVNPSAKLAETFIRDITQCPAHTIGEFGLKESVSYKEGVMVGYRYYDTQKTEVAFCFGHGLSYTKFEYSNLKVSTIEAEDNVAVTVTFGLKNAGMVDGKEIVQVYVAPKNANVIRPIHELKSFDKISLRAGEERQVTLVLSKNAFGYYNIQNHCFYAEEGEYTIEVGASARDIKMTETIDLKQTYEYQ